jgi:uncharacterized protein with NRDE domain
MCLLVLFYRVADDAPVVVGANREEFYQRGGTPPQLLEGPVRIAAGIDPVAGGTWLGVNEHGLLVAVTNRRKSQPPARPRSRGLLARQLLGCASATDAVRLAARELERHPYDGCNLVCVDAREAVAIQAGDWLRVRPLPPGLHAIANGDINDASDRRLKHVFAWLSQRTCSDAASCTEALCALCAHHGPDYPPICFHGDTRGTVSSSVLALPAGPGGAEIDLARGTYLHAQGPPDRIPYADYSALLRQMVKSMKDEG